MRRLFLDTVDSVTARISASGTVAWYLTDRLGSVRVLTDATGAVIDRINYDGFGNILTETNPVGQRPLPLDRPRVRPSHRPAIQPGAVLRPDNRAVDHRGPARLRGGGYESIPVCGQRSDQLH